MQEDFYHSELLKRLVENRLTPADKVEIGNLSDQQKEAFEEISDILQFSSNYEIPKGRDKTTIWGDLENQLEENKISKKVPTIALWPKMQMAIAASLILLLGVFYFSKKRSTEATTNNGEHHVVYLPDSSKVHLNAASRLKFSARTWEEKREVQLWGEAFFEVKKGSKFDVISHLGTVSVLGTSFNVYDRDSKYKVACYTGKVQVKTKNSGSPTILTPGKSLELNDDSNVFSTAQFDEKADSWWQEGIFSYEGTPLTEVLYEMERQFAIRIESEDQSYRSYTGAFSNDDLEEALITVLRPMGLTYKFKNKQIVIISKSTPKN
ncbi:FecR domain-containing protein [Fulvivirgaceae bacterium BMA10]|uniref:FecR domain-containing protein n=1 Tax=Splendidivirga corallicola TaxID=3051826 RepID=A0ABT8KGR8_9BACT|nr:FecR domain-containing protein [Fulvivirgaceae bacterium BMA10]